jgi:hypothetical protein
MIKIVIITLEGLSKPKFHVNNIKRFGSYLTLLHYTDEPVNAVYGCLW